ncbi:MAG: ABC transporter ATP-binding protein [Phycisphaerae bacterium]
MTTIPTKSLAEEDKRLDSLDFSLIRRLMGFTRPYAARRNVLLAIVIIRSIQLPLLAWAVGAAIDGPIRAGDVEGTIWAAAGFAALAAITQLTFHFRAYLALTLGESVIRDLRIQVFSHLQSMTMSFYNRTKIGRILSRMSTDIESMRQGVQDVLFVSLVQSGQMLVAAGLMLYYDWMLFLVVLALVPILWAINRTFRRKLSRSHQEIQESFSRVTSSLAESVSGIRVTQGFVRQDVNAGLFGSLVADHSRYAVSLAKVSGIFLPLLEFNSQFFIASMLLIGGWQVLTGTGGADVGDLVQFFFMANLFFAPIGHLGNQYNTALGAMAGAQRVFRLLDTPPDWSDPVDAIELTGLEGKVEFDDVGFSYEPGRPVLQNVSFCAQPGQMFAFVGHTGSGKSTIINLVSKFYLPDSGQIRIDDTDLGRISAASLHRRMGIVGQQNFLFAGTVMDNIRLGKPSAGDEEIRAAAEALDCLDLLEILPDGLHTVVGERGGGISLGQRQLICFTRAMLADPRILILDEATSSVDTLTEARIQAALTKLFAGRTSFVVAHRLSTVRHAEQVIVLDQGRIVEQGTHLQLLRLGGTYAELYRQFIRSGEA